MSLRQHARLNIGSTTQNLNRKFHTQRGVVQLLGVALSMTLGVAALPLTADAAPACKTLQCQMDAMKNGFQKLQADIKARQDATKASIAAQQA